MLNPYCSGNDCLTRCQVGGVDRTAVLDFFSLTCFVSGAGKGVDGRGCLRRAIGQSIRSIVVRPLRGAAILSNPSRAEGVVFSNGCVVAAELDT